MSRAVVAIYIDPDFFPPTLNAILNLAERVDEVLLISRNNSVADYPFPANVRLQKIGKLVTVREMEKQSLPVKLWSFLKFAFWIWRTARNKETELLLVYDPLALFAFFLVKRLRHKTKIWYHNHDVPDKRMMRKFSLGYWASRYELRALKYIHYFSLPAEERLAFYPMLQKSVPAFVIPNYPSLKVYTENAKTHFKDGVVHLIYQGFIGPGHGLETIIKLLGGKIKGYSVHLVLKGSVTTEYRAALDQLAEEYEVVPKMTWEGIGAYRYLPELTHSCDIGIGINRNKDIVSRTQGTASNKIYEYAASGLPVILNKDQQFTKYLGSYNWAVFTEESQENANEALRFIVENLDALSNSARQDFEKSLNFEKHFIPVLNLILNKQD